MFKMADRLSMAMVAVGASLIVYNLTFLNWIERESQLTREVARLEVEMASRVQHLEKIMGVRFAAERTVTAYSPRKQETDSTPFINACNKRVAQGTVAVSRDLWAAGFTCGKKVLIQGHGYFIVQDKMNARWENRVDIFFNRTKHAYRFGTQRLVVGLVVDQI